MFGLFCELLGLDGGYGLVWARSISLAKSRYSFRSPNA
jgi:hypothetical protein